jgi:hypothetical protein
VLVDIRDRPAATGSASPPATPATHGRSPAALLTPRLLAPTRVAGPGRQAWRAEGAAVSGSEPKLDCQLGNLICPRLCTG